MRKLFTLTDPADLLLPLFGIITIAAIRHILWQYLTGLRGPFGLFAIPLIACPLLIAFFIALIVLGFVIVRSLIESGSLMPTLLLAVGIVFTFQFPLPPRPDTPEKQHFLEYRDDYQRVVELARNGQLEQALPECAAGYRPPAELNHVSSAGCLFIEERDADQGGFTVFFNPLAPFYYPVVYIEFDTSDNPCGYDARIDQQIDPHWFVCQREWN